MFPIMFWLLLLLFMCLVLFVLFKWSRMKRFWADKGIPYYGPQHLILGSLTFFQTENPSLWMRKIYQDFKSPYVGIFVFWRPGLIVNCPNVARRILVKDFSNFRNRLLSSGKSDPVGGLNLVTVNDPLWSSIRKRLTPVFTGAKLRALQDLFVCKSRDLVQRFKEETERGLVINMRSIYADYSTDVIGESAFGIKCYATRTGDSPLRRTTKELSEYGLWRGLAWSSMFFVPELVDVFGTIVAERGGYHNEVNEVRDLLDALIKMKHDADKENEDMSEDIVIAQASIFLQGGFETTSVALTYATYELAFHPHLQEKLFKELSEAKQNLGDEEFDSDVLTSLEYLNCVIKETLRKYPVMGWLDRVALQDYQVDDKLTIPAGTVVYVNAVAMHVDPKYYPDPMVFNPDRFSPENKKNIEPYTFMPFGEGPRGCIGKRFGLNAVRHALTSVILNYRVRPWPNSTKPNDCEVDKRGVLFSPEKTLSVEFIPRVSEKIV